jgi:hypothetical protein
VLNAAMANGSTGSNPINSGSYGIAPLITGVNVGTNSNTNSATINWTTNEMSRGYVYYSSFPLNASEGENSVTVTGANSTPLNSNYAFSQGATLQNLQANTTYYYMIHITDQDGNVSVYPSSFRVN